MPKISALPPITVVAADDEVPIYDKSAQTTKKIPVKQLTDWLDMEWRDALETWVFASWNATTHIGVFTVPTNATLKYNVGMWVRITQATGGTKIGMIVAVTATSISVNMFSHTLENQAITAPSFSALARPVGAPLLPYIWTDANAWSVNDYGTRKTYHRKITGSWSAGGGGWGWVGGVFDIALPAGMATLGNNINASVGNCNDAALTCMIGGQASNSTRLNLAFTNNYGGVIPASAWVNYTILEP